VSNALSIVAVTDTLRNLLLNAINGDDELAGATVTTSPLDKARGTNIVNGNQLNLFLYQTAINPAWCNMVIPSQVKGGESGFPPLALDLYYLITAYGSKDDETLSHRLLGQAMRCLHDHALLGTEELRNALVGSDLHAQEERVRITLQPLSLEEMSKLWTAFQTQYRLSSAYKVSVVLIESKREVKSALPVLSRGHEDRGATVLGSLYPALKEAVPPAPLPSLRLGEDLEIRGDHLDQNGIKVRISGRYLSQPIEQDPLLGGSFEALRIHIKGQSEDQDALTRWAPGFYTVSLVIKFPELSPWITNEVPFALAPIINVSPLSAPPGDLALRVTCSPRIREDQRVTLLFGPQQIPVASLTTPPDTSLPTTLEFFVPDVKAGSYVVRLRVDGVDSLPIGPTVSPSGLAFDPSQRVTVA
jgi:hypothetical protein